MRAMRSRPFSPAVQPTSHRTRTPYAGPRVQATHHRHDPLNRPVTQWIIALLCVCTAWSLLAVPAQAQSPETTPQTSAQSEIVERWHGTVHRQLLYQDTYFPCPGAWVCPGNGQNLEVQEWDLEVHESGAVQGTVQTRLLTMSYAQTSTNINCGPVAETSFVYLGCRYALQVNQPAGAVAVQGIRENDQFSGLPVLRITESERTQECIVNWTARAHHSDTGAPIHLEKQDICNSAPSQRTLSIQVHPDGRAPTIDMSSGFAAGGIASTSWGMLTGTVDDPFLDLDRELLERSVFLAQIPVEELFTANVNWRSPTGGWLTWHWATEPPDRVGPTNDPQLDKPINQGATGPGLQELRVQGLGALGQTTHPEVVQVPVAPLPQWTGNPTQISATKIEGAVSYKDTLTFPEPAFEGNVTVPALIPWFGGNRLGVSETQGSLEWEVLSTSEGQGKLSGQTGFEALGGGLLGTLAGRASVVLTPAGVEIPRGGLDLTIGGKLEKEEPLLRAVPALNPALTALRQISPAAASFIEDRAKAKLEVQPQIELGFNFLTQNDKITFENAQAKPAIGFKTTVELDLIEEMLSASASVGGEVSVGLQVPEPYFQEAALKGLVQAQIVMLRWARSGEHAWSVVLRGAGGAATAQEELLVTERSDDQWHLLPRPYLDDPNYAHWWGSESIYEETHNRVLQENAFPQANPNLHTWTTPQNNTITSGVFAIDTPSSSDIVYTRVNGNIWRSLTRVTEDDHDDWAPRIIWGARGFNVMLWQRMNTPTPPDFNTDPAGYLAGWQIVARSAGSNQPVFQLSDGVTLNYRHNLAATTDGALAVWVNNPANQLIGDATHPDHILYSQQKPQGGFPGSMWTPTTAVISDVVGLLDLDLATNVHYGILPDTTPPDIGAVVYSRDLDGDLATTNDRELFYILWNGTEWGEPIRLTNDNVADELPQLVLAQDGAPTLVWRRGGTLVARHGSWAAETMALDLPDAAARPDVQLVGSIDGTRALLWQAVAAENTGIAYSLYDPAIGQWSDAHILDAPHADPFEMETGNQAVLDRGFATSIAGALNPIDPDAHPAADERNARLFALYQLAHVTQVTRTVDFDGTPVEIPNVPEIGQHDLRVAVQPLTYNLTVTPADVTAPTPTSIQAVIHNTGQLGAFQIPVALHIGVPHLQTGVFTRTLTQTIPALAGGDSVMLTFELTPPDQTAALYTVAIDPDNTLGEENRADNRAQLGAALELDLLPTYYTHDTIGVRAAVRQTSPLYAAFTVPATLVREDPGHAALSHTEVGFGQSPVEALTVSAVLSPTQLGMGRHAVVWTVDPHNEAGDYPLQPRQATLSVMVLPDLTSGPELIWFDTAPGITAGIRMEVHNAGNWTSRPTTVEVFAAMPDTQSQMAQSSALASFPLPAIAPGDSFTIEGVLPLAGLPAEGTGLSGLYVRLDTENANDELNENDNLIGVGDILETSQTTPADYRLLIPTLQR